MADPTKETVARRGSGRPIAQALRRLLASEGYRPSMDSGDGKPSTIRFKLEGAVHLLRSSEDDPGFVQLCTGWTLDGVTSDELILRRAADEVQNEVKVVKLWIPAALGMIELQAELFVGGSGLTPELLDRCISTLRFAAREFLGRVTPDEPKARA